MHYIKFRESSIICKIFTEELGLKSYLINSIRKSGGKSGKLGAFQPLSLLDLVVYDSPKSDLHRIIEFQSSHSYNSIPFVIKKASVAVFLAEVISKCLKENHPEPSFFQFLYTALRAFDENLDHPENFHLMVLIELCESMGVGLRHAEEDYSITDIHGGMASNWQRLQEQIDSLSLVSSQHNSLLINQHDRRELLKLVLYHLSHHQVLQGQVHSLQVLQSVFG